MCISEREQRAVSPIEKHSGVSMCMSNAAPKTGISVSLLPREYVRRALSMSVEAQEDRMAKQSSKASLSSWCSTSSAHSADQKIPFCSRGQPLRHHPVRFTICGVSHRWPASLPRGLECFANDLCDALVIRLLYRTSPGSPAVSVQPSDFNAAEIHQAIWCLHPQRACICHLKARYGSLHTKGTAV